MSFAQQIETFFVNLWASLGATVTSALMKLLWAALVLVIGLKVAKWIAKKVDKSKRMQKVEPTVRMFTVTAISIALKVVVIISVITILGVPTATLTAGVAAAGAAIALGLQGGLSNVAGGITILLVKPFKVGDFITVGGDAGTVMEVNLFYTRLKTADNRHISIPNGSAANSVVINNSEEEFRRVDFVFNVAYGTDTELVRSTLLDIANKHTCVLQEEGKKPTSRLASFGESSLDFNLRVWSKASDYWTVFFDINETVKAEFEKKNIEIPFPQRDVHIISK